MFPSLLSDVLTRREAIRSVGEDAVRQSDVPALRRRRWPLVCVDKSTGRRDVGGKIRGNVHPGQVRCRELLLAIGPMRVALTHLRPRLPRRARLWIHCVRHSCFCAGREVPIGRQTANRAPKLEIHHDRHGIPTARLAVNDVLPPQTLAVQPASTVAVALTDGPGHSTDWVGLYAVGAADSAVTPLTVNAAVDAETTTPVLVATRV